VALRKEWLAICLLAMCIQQGTRIFFMNQKRPNTSQYQQVPQPQFQQQFQQQYQDAAYDQQPYQPYPQQPQQAPPQQQYQPPQYQQQQFQYQQQPYQPPQQNPNAFATQDYFKEFQTSATGQIGMQLGSQAFSQAQAQIQSNVGRYFDIHQWRYYFNVSNSYVFSKLRLILFPFLHKSWSRTFEHGEDSVSYAPPRSDLNAPDLYIPVMSFVTYIILVGISTGLNAKTSEKITYHGFTRFTPDVLGLTASTGFFIIVFEVLFIKVGCYFLNISSPVPFLELFSYTGYKYVIINAIITTKLLNFGIMTVVLFAYLCFAFGFFTVPLVDVVAVVTWPSVAGSRWCYQ
jgi:hypothetical protein